MRKLFYFISLIAALIITAYYIQPIKSGKGNDAFTTYELVENWPGFPANLKLGNPTGIGIDTNQQIVVFHRSDRVWPLIGSMPTDYIHSKTILIIDKNNGNLIDSWGDNLFIMPHGLTVDNENNIWVTDVGLHQVFKFTHNGKLLMKLGEEKVSGNDSLHFNMPTDVAVARDGSFYVSDGYGNSRIIKFSATGKYLFEWGKKGDKEGEFNIPHGIALDRDENVYVADRENSRIQIFNPSGRFLKQWTNKSFGSICSVCFNQSKSKLFAIDDFTFLKLKHRGSDIFVFDTSGNVRTRVGRSSSDQGSISWYHDLVIDRDENIYIGDILNNTILKYKRISIN